MQQRLSIRWALLSSPLTIIPLYLLTSYINSLIFWPYYYYYILILFAWETLSSSWWEKERRGKKFRIKGRRWEEQLRDDRIWWYDDVMWGAYIQSCLKGWLTVYCWNQKDMGERLKVSSRAFILYDIQESSIHPSIETVILAREKEGIDSGNLDSCLQKEATGGSEIWTESSLINVTWAKSTVAYILIIITQLSNFKEKRRRIIKTFDSNYSNSEISMGTPDANRGDVDDRKNYEISYPKVTTFKKDDKGCFLDPTDCHWIFYSSFLSEKDVREKRDLSKYNHDE